MEESVQTARELATHANEIKHLQQDMDKLVQDMDQVKNTLAEIQKTLSEAKGGWRVLMYFGGAGCVVGGALTWVVDRMFR
jgi:prefoldin subunit 5